MTNSSDNSTGAFFNGFAHGQFHLSNGCQFAADLDAAFQAERQARENGFVVLDARGRLQGCYSTLQDAQQAAAQTPGHEALSWADADLL